MTVSCFGEVKSQVCDQDGESRGGGQAFHAGHCSSFAWLNIGVVMARVYEHHETADHR